MLREFPDFVQKWQNEYEPYMEGCHLRDDAPKSAVEAFEKAKAWAWEQSQ